MTLFNFLQQKYRAHKKTGIVLVLIVAIAVGFLSGPAARLVLAQSIGELQNKIQSHNDVIKSLEKEIAQFQTQVEHISKEANTLANAVKALDLTKKKLDANIELTQKKISKTNLQIEQLSKDIGKKEDNIGYNRDIIGSAFRSINEYDNSTLLESLLSEKDLSYFWDEVDSLTRLHEGVKERIGELKEDRLDLIDNRTQTEAKKKELVALKTELNNERQAVLATAKEKQKLLNDTKNLESNYRTILATKVAQKEAFERELFEFESQLKIAIDPSSLPKVGSGVLRWPVTSPVVTQYFGNTPFATANPQIYSGKGHTGIDLRAAVGTTIKAAASGIVTGTGDTDLIRGCYSYGKWVFIKHPNGISTLYAHLSYSAVSTGQSVSAGETIGYSGNTGYSTGPHLHFGVYATQGVRITTFANSINCKGAVIPLADPKAYLNPLSYL
jgi:murein DD-endopeptidase MepM/ murein hydrolase activator NlpD